MSDDTNLEKTIYLNTMKATLKVLNDLEKKNFNKKDDVVVDCTEKGKRDGAACKRRMFNKRKSRDKQPTGNEDMHNIGDAVSDKKIESRRNDGRKLNVWDERSRRENRSDKTTRAFEQEKTSSKPRLKWKRDGTHEIKSDTDETAKSSRRFNRSNTGKRSSLAGKNVEMNRKRKNSFKDRTNMNKKIRR